MENEEEICADNLSDCESSENIEDFLESDSDSNDSDNSDIVVRRRPRLYPLQYSDSENDSDSEDDLWSDTDIEPVLEPFEGVPGVKIMPNSPESVEEVTSLFIGNDLFEFMTIESNRYHSQISNLRKPETKKSIKWTDITVPEMKKFIGLILLMAQVRKDILDDYWSTDPTIETPFFGKSMSRNRFRQIWQAWHFSNNEETTAQSSRIVKIKPIVDYFISKFNTVYVPEQELSLDESIISWRGRLVFKTYNPNKLIKYGILTRMVCEAKTGYICNFEIYTGQGKKLQETILSVLQPFKNLWYHVYQDNFYNSVKITKLHFKNKFRVCGTIRQNRGQPKNLKNPKLKVYETIFKRKNNILLQVWNNGRRNVNMISSIHSAKMFDSTAKRKNSPQVIKKPSCVLDYNNFMKGVDQADQYISYFKLARSTKKWTKRAVLFFLNCALFNAYRTYTRLNSTKIKYKKFLHQVAIAWLTDHEDSYPEDEQITSTAIPSTSTAIPTNISKVSPSESISLKPTKRTPKFDPPGRLNCDLRKHKCVKIVTAGKTKHPLKYCKVCKVHNRKRRTSYVCDFCNIPLHAGTCFEQYHSLKNY